MAIYVRTYTYVEVHRAGLEILTYVYDSITFAALSMNEANQNKPFITLSLINIIKNCLYVLQPKGSFFIPLWNEDDNNDMLDIGR